jgi:hypothetical protein
LPIHGPWQKQLSVTQMYVYFPEAVNMLYNVSVHVCGLREVSNQLPLVKKHVSLLYVNLPDVCIRLRNVYSCREELNILFPQVLWSVR